jgi:hypothetical protein
MMNYCKSPARVDCTVAVQPKKIQLPKQAKQNAQGVTDHLAALAMEMDLTRKRPRFLFWKKKDVLQSYKDKKEMFRMFAHISLMRLQQEVA